MIFASCTANAKDPLAVRIEDRLCALRQRKMLDDLQRNQTGHVGKKSDFDKLNMLKKKHNISTESCYFSRFDPIQKPQQT